MSDLLTIDDTLKRAAAGLRASGDATLLSALDRFISVLAKADAQHDRDSADWQKNRRPATAVPLSLRPPPSHREVLVWLTDADVAIHDFPAVAWLDHDGKTWWSGVPGNYIRLSVGPEVGQWTVTHWLPLNAAEATSALIAMREERDRLSGIVAKVRGKAQQSWPKGAAARSAMAQALYGIGSDCESAQYHVIGRAG